MSRQLFCGRRPGSQRSMHEKLGFSLNIFQQPISSNLILYNCLQDLVLAGEMQQVKSR